MSGTEQRIKDTLCHYLYNRYYYITKIKEQLLLK